MLERYDYESVVFDDVYTAITEDYTVEEIRERLKEDREAFHEEIYERLWTADSVTGNGSGSYTFSTWKAEENLCHNWDLIQDCAFEFGDEAIITADYKHGPEFWDVSIRCYLLAPSIDKALDKLEEELKGE